MRDYQKKLAKDTEEVLKKHEEDMNASKAAEILRSFRPKQGFPRVMQNIGTYGAVGGLTTAMASGTLLPAAVGIGLKAATAVAMSPIAISRAFEWGLKNKALLKAGSKFTEGTGKAVGKSKGSMLMQRLIASSLARKE
jgi:hypothetical protein